MLDPRMLHLRATGFAPLTSSGRKSLILGLNFRFCPGSARFGIAPSAQSGFPRRRLRKSWDEETSPGTDGKIPRWPAPSTWGGAWRSEPWPVGGRDEPTRRQVALRWVSLSGRGHQPGGLVVLPFPTQPADGRGDAGGTRHRCSY